MHAVDPGRSVGECVRQKPSRARVFESFQIDYCCGGKIPLAQACQARGVELSEVLARLDQCDAMADSPEEVDADAMTLRELTDHIESTHHAYLREELPRIDYLTEKVSQVHGGKNAHLLTTRNAFLTLKAELEPHMMKEERILFPMIRQLETSAEKPVLHCGSVANPIRQMEHEHDLAGGALAVLRESTADYAPPEWACNTYRAMLDSLARLETNMHQHVHKENNVLFPKAIELERRLAASE